MIALTGAVLASTEERRATERTARGRSRSPRWPRSRSASSRLPRARQPRGQRALDARRRAHRLAHDPAPLAAGTRSSLRVERRWLLPIAAVGLLRRGRERALRDRERRTACCRSSPCSARCTRYDGAARLRDPPRAADARAGRRHLDRAGGRGGAERGLTRFLTRRDAGHLTGRAYVARDAYLAQFDRPARSGPGRPAATRRPTASASCAEVNAPRADLRSCRRGLARGKAARLVAVAARPELPAHRRADDPPRRGGRHGARALAAVAARRSPTPCRTSADFPGADCIYVGGPVQTDVIVALVELDEPDDEVPPIIGNVGYLPGEGETGRPRDRARAGLRRLLGLGPGPARGGDGGAVVDRRARRARRRLRAPTRTSCGARCSTARAASTR